MNEKAITKIRKNKETFRRYLDTKEGNDYTAYTKARNQAEWETRKAHQSFEKKIAVKSGISDLKNDKGEKISDDGLKAEALNNFFSSVFTIEDTTNMPTFEDRPVLNTLNELNFTQANVQKILQKLKSDKAQVLDGMHPRVLKELNTELAIPLFILFRKTLEYEQIPTAWKEGQIIPIFKKGDKSSVSNCRPVSLTTVISKVMETLVRNNIMEHLINKKLLTDAQHGFVSGRSCVTQLIETIEE